MRLFIAVNIPDGLKNSISELVDRLRIDNDFVRWTRPGNIHLTLKFLGDVSPDLLGEIGDILVETVSRYPPMEMHVENIGAFPNIRRPRVVWLGIGNQEMLQAIRSDLNDGLIPLGFEKESRPFHPHLTIGRIKRGGGKARPATIEDRLRGVKVEAGVFRVTSIELMESLLKPNGALYRVRITAPLREEAV